MACMFCAASWAGPVWVVDPGNPGPDAPREGRSLFDQMTTEGGRQRIPYPFETLLERLNQRLDASNAYLGQPLKKVSN